MSNCVSNFKSSTSPTSYCTTYNESSSLNASLDILSELKNQDLEVDIELKQKRDEMIGQGGDLDFRTNEGNAIALINIPDYKVVE